MTSKWPLVSLASLCLNAKADIVDGPFGSNLKREDYVTSGIPVLKIQNVKESGIVLKRMDYVTPEKFTELTRHSFRRGDIVITKLGDPLGVAAVVSDIDAGLIVADLVRIRSDESRVDTRYLAYAINSPGIRMWLNGKQKGSTRPRVSLLLVREMPIPLPPLDEQKRIVAKLDEAMNSIVEAEHIIEEAVIQLAEFENASREYFLSTIKFKMRVSELSELAEIRYGFTDSASHEKSGPKFLRITDIQDRKVDWSLVPRCEISTDDHEKQRLKSGDLVFARTGATTGKSFLITEDVPDAVAASYLIRVRPNQTKIDSRYLSVYFNSREYWESVEGGSTGSAQGGFNASKLGALSIRFPESLQHQSEIVHRSHNLDEQSSGLKASLLSKATAIDSLKGTLLKAAFAGAL